jgi:hypothetical protein
MRNIILDPSMIYLLADEKNWYVVTNVFMIVVIYKVQNHEKTLLKFIFSIKYFPNTIFFYLKKRKIYTFLLVLIVA